MSRIWIGVVGGILGIFLYIALAMVAGDAVVGRHWALQAVYFVVAGVAWVFPARWLMFWAAGKR